MKLLGPGRVFSYLGFRFTNLVISIKSQAFIPLIDHGEDLFQGGAICPNMRPKKVIMNFVWQP